MIPTKERARGRWRQILPALGIDAKFLTGRNCPCPICGGKDRFRFIDRRDGDGMWLCSQCQPRPRPAIDLAVVYSGRPFREAARVIDDIMGDCVAPMVRRAPADAAKDIARARTCWHRGGVVHLGDVVDRYLRHRRASAWIPIQRACERARASLTGTMAPNLSIRRCSP